MRSLLQSVISALLAADADVVVGAELGERPSASRRPLDFVDEKLPAVLEHLVRLRTDVLSFTVSQADASAALGVTTRSHLDPI
jgi:hypothetical protein